MQPLPETLCEAERVGRNTPASLLNPCRPVSSCALIGYPQLEVSNSGARQTQPVGAKAMGRQALDVTRFPVKHHGSDSIQSFNEVKTIITIPSLASQRGKWAQRRWQLAARCWLRSGRAWTLSRSPHTQCVQLLSYHITSHLKQSPRQLNICNTKALECAGGKTAQMASCGLQP